MATPTIPTLNSAVAEGPYAVRLRWSPSYDSDGDADFSGYKIYRDGTLIKTTVAGSDLQYTDRTVTTAVTYRYHITAYDAEANESSRSNYIYVTTPVTPAQQDNNDYVAGRKDIYARVAALEA